MRLKLFLFFIAIFIFTVFLFATEYSEYNEQIPVQSVLNKYCESYICNNRTHTKTGLDEQSERTESYLPEQKKSGVSQNHAAMAELFPSPFKTVEILSALKETYPDKITQIDYRDDDWVILINNQWLYWCNGRLLPKDKRSQWAEYDRWPFYHYPNVIPPLRMLSDHEKAELDEYLDEGEKDPPSRFPSFYHCLWDITDRKSAWYSMIQTTFLGYRVTIHKEISQRLHKIEAKLREKMETDENLKQFVRSLSYIGGYNWRYIRGTKSLSAHSYGIAVDLVPNGYTGRKAYWRWVKTYNASWYELPYEVRYIPPLTLIKTFEEYGFVWGGKWFFYDTIHFEYRPEILSLNQDS